MPKMRPQTKAHWPVRTVLGVSLLLLAVGRGFSQETVRVDVELVNVVATVTDAEGHYVSGLHPGDFIVEDDGVRQNIAHFSEASSLPISMAIALDTSGSMLERMQTALAALDHFIEGLGPDDQLFVSTFSNRVSMTSVSPTDRAALYDALMRVDASGGTALYDAIAAAVTRVQEGNHDRRAVLVLSDGADTSSSIGLNDVLEVIRRAEVLIYGLGIERLRFADAADHVQFDWPLSPIPGVAGLRSPSWAAGPVDIAVLQSLARASGGKAFLISGTWTDGSASEIDAALDEVAAELRSQYTLGYYPSSAPDGRLHQLRVRIPGTNYRVRARGNYRSPDP